MPYPHSNADGKKPPEQKKSGMSMAKLDSIVKEAYYDDMIHMQKMMEQQAKLYGNAMYHYPPQYYQAGPYAGGPPELPSSFMNPQVIRMEARVDGLGPKVDGRKFGMSYAQPSYDIPLSSHHREQIIRRMFADMAEQVIKEMKG